jgi:hypothetical protein
VIDTLDPCRAGEAAQVQPPAAAIQNVIDLTRTVRTLLADGYMIHRDDLAQLTPCQTRGLKRFGDYTLSLSSPEPFDAELAMPFALDKQPKTGVVA